MKTKILKVAVVLTVLAFFASAAEAAWTYRCYGNTYYANQGNIWYYKSGNSWIRYTGGAPSSGTWSCFDGYTCYCQSNTLYSQKGEAKFYLSGNRWVQISWPQRAVSIYGRSKGSNINAWVTVYENGQRTPVASGNTYTFSPFKFNAKVGKSYNVYLTSTTTKCPSGKPLKGYLSFTLHSANAYNNVNYVSMGC